jgi:hypothetical protein
MCSLEPESYVRYTKPLLKFATKMRYSQFEGGKQTVLINHHSNFLPKCGTVSLKWESRKAGNWEILSNLVGCGVEFWVVYAALSLRVVSGVSTNHR